MKSIIDYAGPDKIFFDDPMKLSAPEVSSVEKQQIACAALYVAAKAGYTSRCLDHYAYDSIKAANDTID